MSLEVVRTQHYFSALCGLILLLPKVGSAEDPLTGIQKSFANTYIEAVKTKDEQKYFELVSQASHNCLGVEGMKAVKSRMKNLAFRPLVNENARAVFGPPSEIALLMVDQVIRNGGTFPLPVIETASFMWPEGIDEVFVVKEGNSYRLLEPCQ